MARDLSKFHQHIGRIFTGGARGESAVSAEQCSFFEAHGYLQGIRLLDDEQIAALRNDLDVLMGRKYSADPRFYEYHVNESSDRSRTLFHALGAWRISPVFHDLVFYRPVAAAASRLLGGPVRFWHDQLFVKPAYDGGVVAWHQDYSYWTRTKPMAHLTCWIALDDATEENGCVHYVPGSHRWPLLPRGPLANDMDSVLSLLSREQRDLFKPVPIRLRAGEASFHHPMTLHGSYENKSGAPRRGVVLNMFRDGVVSDTDEPLLDGVPVVPKGEKIEGRFFPLLSS